MALLLCKDRLRQVEITSGVIVGVIATSNRGSDARHLLKLSPGSEREWKKGLKLTHIHFY